MPNSTHKLIQTVTVGAGGSSSIDFTSIPQTYTDLKFLMSIRTSPSDSIYININSSTANFAGKWLEGNGSAISSGVNSGSGRYIIYPVSNTTNTFAQATIYIPNYRVSENKVFSVEGVMEGGSGNPAYIDLISINWTNTAAITSVNFVPSAYTISQHSTVSLYGISNS